MTTGREVQPRGLTGIAVRLAPVTLVVQLLSFGSSIAMAFVLGATSETDAYYLALVVPFAVYGVLLGALRVGMTPTLTRVAARDPAHFDRQASEILSAVLVAAVALTAIATLAAVALMPAALGDDQRGLAGDVRLLILELSPLGVLGALTGALGAVLTVRDRPIAPVALLACEPVAKTILVLTLGDAFGVHTLVAGNLLGTSIALVALLWLLRRSGIRLRLTRPARTPAVREVATISVPTLIGQTMLYANPVVDRTMASAVGAGAVTQFELGFRLFGVSSALLGSTLLAPVIASWTARYEKGGWPELSASVRRAVSAVLAVVPPVVVLVFLLRHEIVAGAYGGGAYSASDVDGTAQVLGFLMLGLPAQILIMVFGSVFIVRGRTDVTARIALANVLLNVALNFALRPLLGVGGIALSTSITISLLVPIFVVLATRMFGTFHFRRIRQDALRAAVSIALAGGVAAGALAALDVGSSRLAAVAVAVGFGLLVTTLQVLALAGTGDARARGALTRLRRLVLRPDRRARR